jgi:hypothetical protein
MLKEQSETGAATEEEIPQEEVASEEITNEEEVSVEEPPEEKAIDPEKAAIFEKLGIEVKKTEEPSEVEEKKEETQEEEPTGEEKYSKKVKTRIDELTKNWRETERERDELKAKLAIYEKSQEQPPAPEPAQQSAQEQDTTEQELAKLDSDIAELKKERRTARNDFDYDKQDELDDKIEALKEKRNDIKFRVPKVDYRSEAIKAVKQQEFDIASQNFISSNPWICELNADGTANPNYNNVKKHKTMKILDEIEKGWAGTSHELYAELDKRLKEEFPEPTKRRAVPVVRGAAGTTKTAPSPVSAPINPKVANMMDAFFGDDNKTKNRVIENAQQKGATQ